MPGAESHPHTDFVLPGSNASGHFDQSLIATIAYAYSRKWNKRRLECHCYAFWNLVLMGLVGDLEPNAVVLPQFSLHDQADPSADVSTLTMADENAKNITPDFIIGLFKITQRGSTPPDAVLLDATLPFTKWADIEVTAMIIPLLAEIKRPPIRSATSQSEFADSLVNLLDQAKQQLVTQAEYAFQMQPETVDAIVLLACSGEWWCWRIISRQDLQDLDTNSDILGDLVVFPTVNDLNHGDPVPSEPANDPNYGDPVAPEPVATNKKTRRNASRTAKEGKKVYKAPPFPRLTRDDKVRWNKPGTPGEPNAAADDVRIAARKIAVDAGEHMVYHDLGPENSEKTRADPNVIYMYIGWSNCIRFGSEVSAQNLYLIHQFISDARDPLMPREKEKRRRQPAQGQGRSPGGRQFHMEINKTQANHDAREKKLPRVLHER
ncbi:hypothetical protein CVT25_002877 [Psilocybe cyanescens]|uniref:Uncharacterized protein n=1 Tax=Psilocybe cyanescens TaxID=93625 RepID=A0A409WKU0_PSICY|nr:hypothetical protein CVT25_002877 [Psilocybe cyanescens]